MRFTSQRAPLLLSRCLLVGTPAFAQLQSGRIVGTVFDTQKAGIPGATVTVTNLATNVAGRPSPTPKATTSSRRSIPVPTTSAPRCPVSRRHGGRVSS